MRIPCTLDAAGAHRDIVIIADTATLIGEIADRLRTHLPGAHPPHPRVPGGSAPVTLCVRLTGIRTPLILDRHRTLGESALQPGCTLTVIEDGAHPPEARWQHPPAAQLVEITDSRAGAHRARVHDLVAGENLIGRDPAMRVHLPTRDVSRRHAKIIIARDGTARVHDLGSANGVALAGRAVVDAEVRDGDVLSFGAQRLRFMRMPPSSTAEADLAGLTPRAVMIPAPRIVPRFAAEQPQLPAAPQPGHPARMPVLAALVPVLAGAAMFALTQSTVSLLLVGLAPLSLLAAWLDARLLSGRQYRRELAAYCSALDGVEADLQQQQQRERFVRQQANPATTTPLWHRRPEHQTFLEARFGLGTDLSLAEPAVVERAGLPDGLWARVTALRRRFRVISDVPVVEKLSSAGSIGVTGARHAAHDALRSVVVQIASSHSPADVVVAAFCPQSALPAWQWLKWLPHTASAHSPVVGDHLASTPDAAARLLHSLEEVLGARECTHATVRSHLPNDERPVRHHADPVSPSEHSPTVVIVVIGIPHVDPARLVHLAEAGPDAGMHVLWLADTADRLPAACRSWLHIDDDLTARLHRVRSAAEVAVTRLDRLDAHHASLLARAMAPMIDGGALMVDESDLPTRIRLSELCDADLSESTAIARRWARNDSIMSAWGAPCAHPPVPAGLRARVGVGTLGPFDIDLRAQGPHAILGGTTGSGKSEFLQTWIMALAAEYSPDRLTFLLVDYKGGAAFAQCADLPHTVGLVTDLDAHLVQRALVSLRAELIRRERLFNEAGVKDLRAMERLRRADTPPVLVIVVDEFAALAADVPEFVAGIVDIAARGRSLGVHLILATQRPSGVINDNLRANANLRIALRMADVQDSTDVLGTPDAAHFSPEAPGRAAIRVGPGLVRRLQTAYVGAPMTTRRDAADITIADLPFGTDPAWPQPAETRAPSNGPREIERMLDAMRSAAERLGLARPRRPWLDALPEALALPALEQPPDAAGLTLGVADDPAHQRRLPYVWSPNSTGHLRVIGGAGSGRSQLLRTLVWRLAARATAACPVQVYAISSAPASLEVLDALPIVGSIVAVDDRERVQRLLRMLEESARQRLRLLRDERVTSTDQLPGRPPVPIHLLIDDLPALQQRYEFSRGFDVITALGSVIAAGRSVGIHVVFTTDRAGGLPTSIATRVDDTLLLRVADPTMTAMLDVDTGPLAQAPPGRGIVIGGACDGLEVQVGLPEQAITTAEQAGVFADLGRRARDAGVPAAPGIRRLPESVPLTSLPELDDHGDPVFGIADDTLAPVGLPLGEPLLVQGRIREENAAVVSVLARAVHTARPWWRGVLLAPRPTTLAQSIHWHLVAHDEAAVETAVADLLGTVASTSAPRPTLAQFDAGAWLADDDWLSPASEGTPQHRGRHTAAPADDVFVVIDQAADFAGTSIEPRLAELVVHCRRHGVTCIMDADPAVLPTAWELHGAARTIRSGLLLRPEPDDADRYLRATLPAEESSGWPQGRGWLVTGGLTRLVQAAR